ncbi:hypothetical protein V3C99_004878 [Haemonchus contortus]|uniref:Uncharacterized protein n=1 Tax=Haemonchus contortus TaxID=6289 RepID=A0A7I4XSD4_HAECO
MVRARDFTCHGTPYGYEGDHRHSPSRRQVVREEQSGHDRSDRTGFLAAVTMKQGLRCLIPSMESPQEPSHGPEAYPRRSSAEAYSRKVMQEYYEVLRTYVKTEVNCLHCNLLREVAHLELVTISSRRKINGEIQKGNKRNEINETQL